MSQGITAAPIIPAPSDLTTTIRSRIREVVEAILEEELAAALGAGPSERTETRNGYRNGSICRQIVTEQGSQVIDIPRGRLFSEDGTSQEWRSSLIDRYQRRTRRVDEALLGAYLAGANTRRIRKALAPLLGQANLSKSAISRIVRRLKALFEAWRSRSLGEEEIVYLYLDGMYLPVRLARRVVKVPVHAVVGVRSDGEKILLSLSVAASESTASWKSVVDDLVARDLAAPELVILDGGAGLSRAVREAWSTTPIQRCTKHKLENLLSKAPRHAHAELKRDYGAIVYAESRGLAKAARSAFERKWTSLSKEVVRSLREGGDELLSFYRFPKSQWKCLRTTNPLERLNGEFRRRTKTQASYSNEESALVLLWGLVAFGQIRLRRIDGYLDMPAVVAERLAKAA